MQLKIASQVVRLDAIQKGYVLVVGDRRYVAGERSRWTFSTAVVLLIHVLVLWALIGTQWHIANLPVHDDDVIQAELYRPVEPPVPPVEPVPVTRQPVPEPEPQPQPPAPQQAPPKAAAQPVPAPPAPVPTPPVPVPVQPPHPEIKIAPRPQDDFSAPSKLSTQPAKAEPKVQAVSVQAPTIEEEPKASNVKVKKKEDEQIDAKTSLATAHVPDAGDIKLHEAPSLSIQTVVAPSGLTPDGNHLATGASAPAGGGGSTAAAASLAGAAGAAGGKGKLTGGRGNLTQALQNDDYCLKAQRDGKPIPGGCHLKGMAQMAGLNQVLSPEMQKEAAAHDFQQRYKTQPGNAAYWKRGNAPEPNDAHISDDDQAGAYTSAKDQRVMTGTDSDPKNSIHKEAH